MALNLEILTTSQTLMKGQVEDILIPSVSGEVNLLPQHTHYTALLGPGKVAYSVGGKREEFRITGGLATIENDQVTLLVDSLLTDFESSRQTVVEK